jgi:phage anti-repressor protein
MPDLIPIIPRKIGAEMIPTVDARDLYAFLDLSRDYNAWIKGAINRANLVENVDFIINYADVVNSKRGRPSHAHHLTFDAAKHVAMMSSATKGHEVRAYFIEKEKEAEVLRHATMGSTLDVHSYQAIMVMFDKAAGTAIALRQELDTKVSKEEARAIAEETVQEALAAQRHQQPGITDGKVTLLTYLDEIGQSEQRPQFWQDWMTYYDIASLEEPPELVLQTGRRWPWRYYTRETHAKAFAKYQKEKKHEDWYRNRET